MKTKPKFLITMVTLFISIAAFAHEGHHKKDTTKKDTLTQIVSAMQNDSVMQHEMEEHHEMKAVDAFPNYHPLVVHFPIVLLLMAAIFQLLSFFFYKEELGLVTLILLALGVVSAWLASNTFHAHPEELTGSAKEIFETHEQMASFTWWFSLTALLLKIPSHFFLKRKWWLESAVALLLITSAVTVSIAGHHGAMLVHMEGIGVKGEHLESHE